MTLVYFTYYLRLHFAMSICKLTKGKTPVVQKFDSPIWVMCTVKVPISLGDNRSFKSNTLCSSDGPFRTLIETWLGSCVLIIDHNLPLIRNLKQREYCFYKCSIDCCGKFTKTLLTNKDINTPVLSFWWALNVVYMMFSWFNYVTNKPLLAG